MKETICYFEVIILYVIAIIKRVQANFMEVALSSVTISKSILNTFLGIESSVL